MAGTFTAELLLDRLTLSPPLGAAELSVTVQASVADPVIDPLVHERPLNAAAVEVAAATPVPLRLITAVPFVEELLVILNWPVADPVAVGSNCTVRLKVLPEAMLKGAWLELLIEKDCPVTPS